MLIPRPIHPFPARMAPEVVLNVCTGLRAGATVLDPMSGSGTVLRMAAEQGHQAYGFDVDPLAVLMAKVWTTPLDAGELIEAGERLVAKAKGLCARDIALPWIDGDKETKAFVGFWFGREQRADLRRLSFLLAEQEGAEANALRIALSRLVITKDKGASLAADVSHSRPHRVMQDGENDFRVLPMFRRSVRAVATRLAADRLQAKVEVKRGDARRMGDVPDASISAIVTSPPYLNAIDYLRGHRMALVWLGHRLSGLRSIRSASVGAERAPDAEADEAIAKELTAGVDPGRKLESRRRRMVDRYAIDMNAMLMEAYRVLEPGGKAVLVVGDSTHRGVYVENTAIVKAAGERNGFAVVSEKSRDIPPSRRYLPPPSNEEASTLKRRMRKETILTLVKA